MGGWHNQQDTNTAQEVNAKNINYFIYININWSISGSLLFLQQTHIINLRQIYFLFAFLSSGTIQYYHNKEHSGFIFHPLTTMEIHRVSSASIYSDWHEWDRIFRGDQHPLEHGSIEVCGLHGSISLTTTALSRLVRLCGLAAISLSCLIWLCAL